MNNAIVLPSGVAIILYHVAVSGNFTFYILHLNLIKYILLYYEFAII